MITAKFTTEEMALLCRALSDSMNYKPNDCFLEKYSLLLVCKRYELGSDQKDR